MDGFRPWEYRETISDGPELLVAYGKIYIGWKTTDCLHFCAKLMTEKSDVLYVVHVLHV